MKSGFGAGSINYSQASPYTGTLTNIDANLMVDINISYEINYSVAA